MLKKILRISLKAVLPIAVIMAAVSVHSYLKSTKPEVKQREAREKVWPVRSALVTFTDHQPIMRLFGQTVSGRHVDLRAFVSGKVIETGSGLKEGGEVKKNDLILKIDPFEYEGALTEAKASVAEAKAKLAEYQALLKSEQESLARAKEQLELADSDLQRAVPLVKKGTVSKQTSDQRRLTVSQRTQSVEQITNNIAVQQARAEQQKAIIDRLAWKVTDAERNLQDTELRAPFDAYVQSVNAEQGRMLGINDSVANLLDKNWIDVKFTLSDSQYGRVLAAEGSLLRRDVTVKWFVGDTPLTYSAKVERVDAQITAEKGGVTLYARLNDPNTPSPIRAGAFVEVMVPDRSYARVARLPRTSLYGRDKVFVIEDDRLIQRDISVIGTTDNEILVRGNIKENEKILTTRLAKAGEGLKVRILTDEDRRPQRAPQEKQKPAETANKKGAATDSATDETRSSAEKPHTQRQNNQSWSPVGTAAAQDTQKSKRAER